MFIFDMTRLLDPFRFVVIALSGWMNGRQLLLIDYLREENRVLREQLGPCPGGSVQNDDERCTRSTPMAVSRSIADIQKGSAELRIAVIKQIPLSTEKTG